MMNIRMLFTTEVYAMPISLNINHLFTILQNQLKKNINWKNMKKGNIQQIIGKGRKKVTFESRGKIALKHGKEVAQFA